jgi:hypothetical protein
MAGPADSYAVSRRHYLAALVYEAGLRGLECRLLGPDEDILRIADSPSGRSTMVVAVPSSPVAWTYLWSGGGAASVTDPSRAADLIAAALGR